MRVGLRGFVVIAVLCAASSTLLGQSAQPEREATSVTIPFFVTDAGDAPVQSIVASDLSIRDDKALPKAILALHGPTELPLRLAVVIQDSGSMKDNSLLPPTLAALPVFLRSVMISKSDQVFFETFGRGVHSTNWMDVVAGSRLSFKIQPRGISALYDAVESACMNIEADSTWPARRVILLITDGHDYGSHANQDAVTNAILRSRSVLFVLKIGPQVGLSPFPEFFSATKFLQDVVDETGGAFVAGPPYWPSLGSGELERTGNEHPARALAKIGEWVNGMYAITYLPAEPPIKDQRRKVRIEAVSKRGRWHFHAPELYAR